MGVRMIVNEHRTCSVRDMHRSEQLKVKTIVLNISHITSSAS